MDSTTGMADALLVGRMRLVSRKEDGVNGCVLGFEAASVRLSRRELSVLAAAEGGVANKLVAIEQSLSCSTVSESLQMALTKLGYLAHNERLAKYHGTKACWVLDSWIETWLSPAFARWNLDEDLRGVHCPILAIHGDRDEYGSLLHPQRIKSLAAGACQAVILGACGHIPYREHPGRVIDEIARFAAS